MTPPNAAPTIALDPGDLIRKAPSLGSPPVVYRKLMQVIDDDRSGAADVAEVISKDTALTLRLLKLVNSAFYAFRQPVDSVRQAATLVGTAQVRDLALATSVTTFFVDVSEDLIHAGDFWRHSLATGIGARVIAGRCHAPNVERYFAAGMLHDVGRLVLYLNAPEESRAIVEYARQNRIFLYEAERQLAGFDHGTLGGALMEHWNMPESLTEAIALHHDPEAAQSYPLEVSIVHVADIIAHALELGQSGEHLVPDRSELAVERIPLDADDLEVAAEEIEIQYQETVHAFELGGEGSDGPPGAPGAESRA